MAPTYEEAIAQLTAEGQLFELADLSVRGITYKVFRHAAATLKDVFAPARTFGDRPFMVYEEERWSFAETMASVDSLGDALVMRYGIAKGDRVAIAMRNLPEWVISFAATTSVGAIAVSLNAWWSDEELAYGLEDSGASLLIADPERAERTRAACRRLGIPTLVARSPAASRGTDQWHDVVVPGRALPDVDVEPDDDATILYTSGTTGRPKGAVSTHRAVTQALFAYGCAAVVDRVRRPQEPQRPTSAAQPVFILIVPLFHVTGCIPVMLSCFSLGMRLVMMYRWDPEAALALIERERVTNFIGVPTQSWDLLESPRFKDFDTSSLTNVGGGGAPAPPSLVERVEGSFKEGRPTIGYGMTETNAYGPTNSGDDYVSHPSSTGRTVPIMEVGIRDEAGQRVATGERGEIWFKGPNLFRGYWRKPEATSEALVNGWLRTGDVGHVDDEGFIYVDDRIKDVVLRGGENVYCAEVEAAIYEHPAVYEAVVLGAPHPRLGEEVVAVVMTKEGAALDAAALQSHVAARLAAFKVPSRIVFVDEPLPRSATGKVLKRDLRERML